MSEPLTPPLATDASARIPANNFDFLRFFLATLVILSHSYPMLSGTHDGEPLMRLSREQWTLGDVCVNFFFVLSGFLITHSWLHSRSAADFFRKRVLRIYPAFVLAMAVCFLVVVPLASPEGLGALTPKEFARHAVRTLMLQRYIDDDAFAASPLPHVVNGSTWTIFYELFCYGLTAALGLVGFLRRPRLVAGLFVGCLALHSAAWLGEWSGWREWKRLVSFDPAQAVRFITYYLAGVVFYHYRNHIPTPAWAGGLGAAALLGLAPFPGALTVLMPLLGAYAILVVAFLPPAPPPLRQVGRFFLRHLPLRLPDPATAGAVPRALPDPLAALRGRQRPLAFGRRGQLAPRGKALPQAQTPQAGRDATPSRSQPHARVRFVGVVRVQGSGVRVQGSGVRSQGSGVRSQESGVRE